LLAFSGSANKLEADISGGTGYTWWGKTKRSEDASVVYEGEYVKNTTPTYLHRPSYDSLADFATKAN